MPITVTYENEAYPKDTEFDIPGLGILVNGESKTLTEDQEREFIARNAQTVGESMSDSDSIKLIGTTLVPGGVVEVLGYDPSEVTDTPVPPVEVSAPQVVTGGNTSNATATTTTTNASTPAASDDK